MLNQLASKRFAEIKGTLPSFCLLALATSNSLSVAFHQQPNLQIGSYGNSDLDQITSP